jgi:hypothetical protein
LIETVLLAFLAVAVVLLFVLSFWVRSGRAGKLRALAGLEKLSELVEHSAETGNPLHVSVGVAGVGGPATSETWAGLTVLKQVAGEASACDAPLLVTVADPTVVPLVEDILQRAYDRYDNLQAYDPTQVRYIAPDSTAYAAGTMGLLARQPMVGSIMVGAYGDEYLLMGETGAQRGVYQVVGTSDPNALALVSVAADEMLVGEEMFAGGAFTSRLPAQIGSLLAEDWLRWLIVAAIVVLTIWKVFA